MTLPCQYMEDSDFSPDRDLTEVFNNYEVYNFLNAATAYEDYQQSLLQSQVLTCTLAVYLKGSN